MKNIFTICVAIVIFSVVLFGCGQGSSKQKELELKEKELLLKEKELQLKEDSIKEVNKNEKPSYAKTEIENKITTKSDIEEKCIILNTWLKYAIGYNSGININTFIKANFNSVQNYKNSISSSFKEKINFRVNGIKPEIEVSNKSIILTFTLENQGYEKFIILEDKSIQLSLHNVV